MYRDRGAGVVGQSGAQAPNPRCYPLPAEYGGTEGRAAATVLALLRGARQAPRPALPSGRGASAPWQEELLACPR